MRRDKILGMIWDSAGQYDQFDYPDYGGLPQSISSVLSSEFVDGVQENWDLINQPGITRRQWVKQALDTIKGLGDSANSYADLT